MSANPSLRASSSAALSNSLPQHLHSTSSAEQLIFTVDSFDNGVAFGSHKKESHQDSRDCFALRVHEDSDLVKLRSRYTLHRKNLLHELERRLMRISDSGRLASSTIYFGVATDPFHPFEGKFDASMRFLELFKRYTPGKLIIQTRSPLLVLAMPIFQRLGEHVALTIGVETHCDRMAQRYTPHLPRPSERLKAALTLKRFGLQVSLQVAPVLPYGDWREDALRFAEELVMRSDHIYVNSITDGTPELDRRVRRTNLAKKLASDRKFFWLRRDSAVPLITAIERLDQIKLKVPRDKHMEDKQLSIFAA